MFKIGTKVVLNDQFRIQLEKTGKEYVSRMGAVDSVGTVVSEADETFGVVVCWSNGYESEYSTDVLELYIQS